MVNKNRNNINWEYLYNQNRIISNYFSYNKRE